MCLFNNEKGEKKIKILAGEAQKVRERERERGGGYIKNHMRVRKGRSFPIRALQSHWATYGRGPKRKHTCWDIQRGEKDGRWR